MNTNKALRDDKIRLLGDLIECYDFMGKLVRENRQLRRENKGLRRANIALGNEVNFLCGKIDRAINYCECKKREKNGTPAWLREVIRDA